uniref:hypothetical protein n=1 Tax=Lithothamnion corallioides TaxID=1277934 RepID=UPI0023F099A1|nr:hypothetical protein P6G75_pgp128 [Lithothamnion corallioides]WEA76995.1 hypothetical protein [Lithothamnion corallioides]
MIQTRFMNEKIKILLICLDSLDLYSLDNLHASTNKELYKTEENPDIYHKYYINNRFNYSIQETLHLIHIINNIILEKPLKEKIQTVLSDYSSCSSTRVKNFSLTTRQYLNRFTYKCQIFYKYNLTKKIHMMSNQRKHFYNIAIINLYILNKILSTNGPYILYKYLHLNKYNLKSKLG